MAMSDDEGRGGEATPSSDPAALSAGMLERLGTDPLWAAEYGDQARKIYGGDDRFPERGEIVYVPDDGGIAVVLLRRTDQRRNRPREADHGASRHAVLFCAQMLESLSGFRRNDLLRGVLKLRSGEVEPAQMRQALKRTLAALQRDVITDDPALYRALPRALRLAVRPTMRCRAVVPPVATARCAGSGAYNDARTCRTSTTQR